MIVGDEKNYEDLSKFHSNQLDRRQKMIDDLAQHRANIVQANDHRRHT